MLDIVKQKPTIEAYDLSQIVNKRLNLGTGYHIIFSALHDKHEFGSNGSYVEVTKETLQEYDGICEGWDEDDNFDFNKIDFESLSLEQKVDYELLKMMGEGLIPEEFILFINW